MKPAMAQWKHVLDALGAIVLLTFTAIGLSLIAVGTSSAQNYPSKLIKFVVPFVAGGPPDAVARMIAPALSSRLGQTIIVENRPGGGMVGTKAVATAAPDGYTLLFGGVDYTQAPALYKG